MGFELVIGIILIAASLFLIIAVLMQHGKDHNLSGTIAGASESFFGKSKSTTLDKKLSVLTSVVAVIFVVLVLVMFLGQGKGDTKQNTGGETTAATVNTPDENEGTDNGSEEVSNPEEEPVDSADGSGEVSNPEGESVDSADGSGESNPEDGAGN